MAGPHIDVSVNDAESIMFPTRAAFETNPERGRPIEVADIIADAVPLPPLDAAHAP